jgi:threonine/homoserine/homoserine lactone efflux protein
MDINLVNYFLVGTVVCFTGTLPIGPINLAVVKITVDKNHLRGFEVALAASIVEIFQALIALWFGMVISNFLETNTNFRLLIAALFIALGIVVWKRKPSDDMKISDEPAGSEFKTGFLIATLNPQAIPFWIFALAAISQYTTFNYEGIYLAGFLAGVFIGKLLALSGFVLISQYLKTRLRQSGLIVNRLLAAVLCIIGAFQLLRTLPEILPI